MERCPQRTNAHSQQSSRAKSVGLMVKFARVFSFCFLGSFGRASIFLSISSGSVILVAPVRSAHCASFSTFPVHLHPSLSPFSSLPMLRSAVSGVSRAATQAVRFNIGLPCRELTKSVTCSVMRPLFRPDFRESLRE